MRVRKWFLIIAFVNLFGDGGMAISTAGPFETWDLCNAAGQLAAQTIEGAKTDIRFTCVDGGETP